MSSLLRLPIPIVALALLSVSNAAPPMTILPMGDSITQGNSQGGYRATLRGLLTTAGYEVDYVGTNLVNPGTLTDKEHEGHSGWRIDQLDSNISGWLAAIKDPDFVLLHIGTNDFGQSYSTATAIDRLDALILKIATLRPHTNIIVTNLMERGEPQNAAIQTLFNPYVQARVNAHAAAGRKVTFLDMRSKVPLSDMPDLLHPNQTGYDKMASAYLEAIQALSSPDGDFSAPAISRVQGLPSHTEINVVFSKPVADTAANVANFQISGGLSIQSATLDSTKRVVTLVTSPQSPGASYSVTVNNVVDLETVPKAIAADSSMSFASSSPRGYMNHVPEAGQYTLVYSLDVPNTVAYRQAQPAYSLDHRQPPFPRPPVRSNGSFRGLPQKATS